MTTRRCAWAEGHELLRIYHDAEWGVPVRDDRLLFEMLCLEGAQAGLSWLTILKKREGYRRAFAGFDPKKVAKFDEAKCASLLLDAGIVRHAGKISAVVDNGRATLAVQREFGALATYLWGFVGGTPARGGGTNQPTPISLALSKDLKKRGFRFVGQTTVYAFMQGVGLVNDHAPDCFRVGLV